MHHRSSHVVVCVYLFSKLSAYSRTQLHFKSLQRLIANIYLRSLSLSPFLFDFRSTHFNKRTEQEKIEKVKLSLSIQTKGEVCVTEMNYTVDIHRLVQVQVNQNRIFLSVKSLSSHLFRMVTFRASKN